MKKVTLLCLIIISFLAQLSAQTNVNVRVQFSYSTNQMATAVVNACEQTTVQLQIVFNQNHSGQFYFGVFANNAGEFVSGSNIIKNGSWNLFHLDSNIVANDTIDLSYILHINCAALTATGQYTDPVKLFGDSLMTSPLPDSLFQLSVIDSSGNNAGQIVYDIRRVAFAASASNLNVNYVDVYNALHSGQPVTRSITYLNTAGTPTDTFYVSFTDTILCNQILISSVEIRDEFDTLIQSYTGINAHIFQSPVIPIHLNASNGLRVVETFSLPFYDSICVASCPIDSNSFHSALNYGCKDATTSGQVTNLCMKTYTNTPLVLGNKIPRVRIARLTPFPNVPGTTEYWDTLFTSTTFTSFRYAIWNDSSNVVKDIEINLGESIYTPYYSYFIEDSTKIKFDSLKVHGTLSPPIITTYSSAYGVQSPQCVRQSYPNAVRTYTRRIDFMLPGDTLYIDFDVVYCCHEADVDTNHMNLFNENKMLNAISIGIKTHDECNIEGTATSFVDTSRHYYGIGQNGATTFNGNFIKQLGLGQLFSPNNLNFNVDSTSCSPPMVFKIDNIDFQKDQYGNPYFLNSANFFTTDYNKDTLAYMHMRGKVIYQFEINPGLSLDTSSSKLQLINGFGVWPIDTVTISNGTCQLGGVYRIIYDIKDCPGGNSLEDFYGFMNSSHLSFQLTGCCCSNNNNPEIKIKTYMSGIDPTCEVPMSVKGATAAIHCPGCNLPGVIAEGSSIPLYRSSVGFEDADNDGLADNLNRLDSSYIANQPLVAQNASFVGDTLYSQIDAHIYQDATYTINYLQANLGITLNHYYLEQVIPYSNSSQFDVKMDEVMVMFTHQGTTYTRTLVSSDPLFGLVVYDKRDDSLATGHRFSDLYFYDVSIRVLDTLFNLSPFTFSTTDHISIRPKFHVCGNYQRAKTALLSDNVFSSKVDLFMYLTGVDYAASGRFDEFISHRDSIATDVGILGGLSDSLLYYCEGQSGFHYFYSIYPKTTTTVAPVNGSICNKMLTIHQEVFVGGNSINAFPYEFRKIPEIDKTIVDLPGGIANYTFGRLDPVLSFSKIRTLFDGGCNIANIHTASIDTLYQFPNNGEVHLPFAYADENIAGFYNSVCNGDFLVPMASPLYGDEYLNQQFAFPFTWDMCGVDSTIELDSTFVITHLAVLNCHGIDTNTMDMTYHQKLVSPFAPNFSANSVVTNPADRPEFCFTLTLHDNQYLDGRLDNVFVYLPELPFMDSVTVNGNTAQLVQSSTAGKYYSLYSLGNLAAPFLDSVQVCGYLTACHPADTTFQVHFGYDCGHVIDSIAIATNSICFDSTRNVHFQLNSTSTYFTFTDNIDYRTCEEDTVSAKLECNSSSIRNVVFSATTDSALVDSVQYYFTYYHFNTNPVLITPDSVSVTGGNQQLFYFNSAQANYPGYLIAGDSIVMSIVYTPSIIWTHSPFSVSYHSETFCGDAQNADSALQITNFHQLSGGCFSLSVNPSSSQVLACDSSKVTITAHGSNGISPYTYHWTSNPSGYSSFAATNSVYPTQNTYYICTVTDSTGATSTDSIYVSVINAGLCCVPSGFQATDYNLSNMSASSLGYTTLYAQNNLVLINGVFTVDTDFTFNACYNILMGPGALINVLPGKMLYINDSHIYAACDQLSQGILVRSNAHTRIISSTIEDAQYAVHLYDSSYASLSHVALLNNYTGVKIEPEPSIFGPSSISVHLAMGKVRFGATRHLKSGYSGQYPLAKTMPYAGIDADRVAFLNISTHNPPIDFDHLNMGIHTTRTNVNVEHSKFKFITGYDDYGFGKDEFGAAIYADGINYSCQLSQIGDNDSADVDFENCRIGVLAKRTSVESSFNQIVNCDFGLRCKLGTSREIKFHNNTMDCNRAGIGLTLNDGSLMTEVFGNHIEIGKRQLNLSGTTTHGYGIWASEVNQYNSDVKIMDNEVSVYPFASTGIAINGVESYQLLRNSVHLLNSTNTALKGITIMRTNSTTVSCNNVYGSRATQDSSWTDFGILIQDSKANTIGCNLLTHTAKGIIVKGACYDSNNQTSISTNEFGKHSIPLLYTGSADINPQYSMGNLWKDSTYLIGALNLNAPRASFEKYFYQLNGDSRNHPDTAKILPSLWFEFWNDSDMNCGTPPRDICISQDSLVARHVSENLEELNKIANDSSRSVEYDPKARREAQISLYEKLLNEPIYLDSSMALTTFYEQMAGTAIQQLASINIGEDSLLRNASNLAITVQGNGLELYRIMQQIRTCDSIISDTSRKVEVIDSAQIARHSLITQGQNLISFNTIALQSLHNAKQNSIDLLSNVNDNMSILEGYEALESQINDVYYLTIGTDQADSAYIYQDELLSIASICPLANGPSVYHARALYSLIDPEKDWDDDAACLQEGYYFRLQKGNTGKSVVYPNPTTGTITIVYNIEVSSTLEIIDAYGRLCFEQKLSGNSNSSQLDLSSLNEGMYSYRIISNGELIDTGKIAIVR